jgi:hypothetical protein
VSTRGIIARTGANEGEFVGRYHHWDSNPVSLGKTLWALYHGHFKKDLGKMLATLLDKHPAGWSTINRKDFNLKPGYTNTRQRPEGMALDKWFQQPLNRRPQCYCHGDRHEQVSVFTQKDLEKGTDIEWLYAFDENQKRLHIRDVGNDAEINVELEGREPNWHVIECGENFERCTHYAWYHNLVPKTCNLSTQAWLGNRPLEFHDAAAYIIDGKRYLATGSGGNGDYLRRMTGQDFPSSVWIATVQAGNGKRINLPVANIISGGYTPYKGVIWVFPPTKSNPTETEVKS